jgi:hypothetical protein
LYILLYLLSVTFVDASKKTNHYMEYFQLVNIWRKNYKSNFDRINKFYIISYFNIKDVSINVVNLIVCCLIHTKLTHHFQLMGY